MKNILRYLFYLILIIFPFGQIFRLNFSSVVPGLKIQPLDFSIFLFNFAWVLKTLIYKRKITFSKISKALALFGAIAVLSLIVKVGKIETREFFVSFLYLLRLVNTIVFLFSITDFLKENSISIFDYLLGEGILIAFFSLFQYLFLPNTKFLVNFGWDPHFFRAIGTFLDPSYSAILLVLSFFIWINSYSVENAKKVLFWLAGPLLLFAIGLSFSRIAYFSLIAGLGAIFLPKNSLKKFIFLVLIIFGVIILVPKPGGEGVNLLRTSSFVSRFGDYRHVIAVIKDNWLTGVGYNNYRYAQKKYGYISLSDWQETNAGAGADNSLLFIFATTGVFGFFSYLVFFGKSLYLCRPSMKSSRSSTILFSSLIALSLSAMVINCLFYEWINVWLMILLGKFTVDS